MGSATVDGVSIRGGVRRMGSINMVDGQSPHDG